MSRRQQRRPDLLHCKEKMDEVIEVVDSSDEEVDAPSSSCRCPAAAKKRAAPPAVIDLSSHPKKDGTSISNGKYRRIKTSIQNTAPPRLKKSCVVIDLTSDNPAILQAAKTLGPQMACRKSLRGIWIQRRKSCSSRKQLAAQSREVIDLCSSDECLARKLQQQEDEAAKQRGRCPEETMDVLQDHRQNIRQIVQINAASLPITAIEENPHSKVGTPLYNRFVQAWQQVQDQSVTLAFHGTSEGNIESICRYGLDPSKRCGQALGVGEYFGQNALTSHPYCKGGKKMLVVALLMDSTGLTCNQNGVVVIHKPEHQLPLFVLTFR